MKKGNREKNKVEENNVTITHKTEAEKFSSYFETIVENFNLLSLEVDWWWFKWYY